MVFRRRHPKLRDRPTILLSLESRGPYQRNGASLVFMCCVALEIQLFFRFNTEILPKVASGKGTGSGVRKYIIFADYRMLRETKFLKCRNHEHLYLQNHTTHKDETCTVMLVWIYSLYTYLCQIAIPYNTLFMNTCTVGSKQLMIFKFSPSLKFNECHYVYREAGARRCVYFNQQHAGMHTRVLLCSQKSGRGLGTMANTCKC